MLKHKGKVEIGVPWSWARAGIMVITIVISFTLLTGGAAEAAAPFTPSFSPEVGLIPYDQQAIEQGSPALGMDSNGNSYALWVDYRNGHPDIYFAYRPAGGDWGSNVKVNDDAGKVSQYHPAIAVDDLGNAFAVWSDERNGHGDIYFSHRPVGGNWETNVKVNDANGTAWYGNPAVATDGNGKAYVIWQDSPNLYFSTVSKTLSAWTAALNILVNDTVSINPRNPSIGTFLAFSDRWVVAVWEDYRNGNWDIYSSALYIGPGGTWQANSKVNDDNAGTEIQRNPRLAVRGIFVMAVWEDYRNKNWDIYSSILLPTWWANEKVNDDTSNKSQNYPSIAVEGTNAYAVWEDRRNDLNEIYYAYRPATGGWINGRVNTQAIYPSNPVISVTGNGQPNVLFEAFNNGNPDIFSTTKGVSGWDPEAIKVNDDPGTVTQRDPALAVHKTGSATALWRDTRNGLPSIYSAHRPLGGTWGSYAPVNDLAPFFTPSIALDRDNNAYAIWRGERIFFSYRPAGGAWGDIVPVSSGIDFVVNPDMAVDSDGNAYAVWAGSTPGGADIYFSFRPAGGAWGTDVIINDYTPTTPKGKPAIGVDGSGNALAIWEDTRNGGRDIYASHRPAGGSWGDDVKVNETSSSKKAFAPAIALDRVGNAYALWIEAASGVRISDIFFSYRPVGGGWGTPVKVSTDSYLNRDPDIAVDDQGNAFAVWVEGEKIVFSYRPVGGGWKSPTQVSTDSSIKWYPRIALDGNRNIYILWQDERYGEDETAILFSYAAGPLWEIYLPLIIK